ncbi:hypothetical protein P152DRAFT_457506 [Eremomyces bilateralis CBS 781.70]|uniref:DUF2423 domain-containing protein n=1 Tax=Eremomyces bilateralis CBS 781.70 TaxID=1392243 RepID=A0A6G1G5N6_9PEZI|nr:uncharacterized protein P152DRAFT_457506 [Eremomyces bilateralis CBS 781.70]KAF1813149.1 hypothetical protein P152DRAFT_457506 [Eremomyces bilateralis CBS 781.70]
MAKSLRSRSAKAQKTQLRRRVFGPVEEERIARLSAAQQELAGQKIESPKMDIDEEKESEQSAAAEVAADPDAEVMDVDEDSSKPTKKSQRKTSRISKPHKKRRSKSAIRFPSMKKSKNDRIGRA